MKNNNKTSNNAQKQSNKNMNRFSDERSERNERNERSERSQYSKRILIGKIGPRINEVI